MIITTKYDVGDKVWSLIQGKAKETEIFGIRDIQLKLEKELYGDKI